MTHIFVPKSLPKLGSAAYTQGRNWYGYTNMTTVQCTAIIGIKSGLRLIREFLLHVQKHYIKKKRGLEHWPV